MRHEPNNSQQARNLCQKERSKGSNYILRFSYNYGTDDASLRILSVQICEYYLVLDKREDVLRPEGGKYVFILLQAF